MRLPDFVGLLEGGEVGTGGGAVAEGAAVDDGFAGGLFLREGCLVGVGEGRDVAVGLPAVGVDPGVHVHEGAVALAAFDGRLVLRVEYNRGDAFHAWCLRRRV